MNQNNIDIVLLRDEKGRFMKGMQYPSHWRSKQLSEEHKINIGKAGIGRIVSIKTREKISKAHKGNHLSPESEFKKGHKTSDEIRMKISKSLSGNKSLLWKGGKTEENILRVSKAKWRTLAKKIRKRDNYTCQECGKCPSYEVHHKISWQLSKNNNGDNLITLCKSCHAKMTVGERIKNK